VNIALDTPKVAETTKQASLNRQALIEAIASAVKSHGLKNLGGMDKIEDYGTQEAAELPIDNTVFEVMAQRARMLGVEVDNTVGGVMHAVYGIDRDSALVRDYAHEIGCHCKGEYISPDVAASRILNVGKNIVA
jgi:hypothetical protein